MSARSITVDLGNLDPIFAGWELTLRAPLEEEAPPAPTLPGEVEAVATPPEPSDAPPHKPGTVVIMTNALYNGMKGTVVDCTWSGGNAYNAKPHWLVKVQLAGTKFPSQQVVLYDSEVFASRNQPVLP